MCTTICLHGIGKVDAGDTVNATHNTPISNSWIAPELKLFMYSTI